MKEEARKGEKEKLKRERRGAGRKQSMEEGK